MARTTDQQLALFAPELASPRKGRTPKACKHAWEQVGIEVIYCRKCKKAFISVDGISFEDTWPLTKSSLEGKER
jgi:hypothetical protein